LRVPQTPPNSTQATLGSGNCEQKKREDEKHQTENGAGESHKPLFFYNVKHANGTLRISETTKAVSLRLLHLSEKVEHQTQED